jgi:hypothetical protein
MRVEVRDYPVKKLTEPCVLLKMTGQLFLIRLPFISRGLLSKTIE